MQHLVFNIKKICAFQQFDQKKPKNKSDLCAMCAEFYLLTLLKEFNLIIIIIMNARLTFSVMLAFLIIESTDIGKKQV